MTDDVVQRARQALEGITTPTPWSMHHGSVYGVGGPKSTYYGRDGHPSVATAEGGYVEGEFTDGDGEFIAASPQLVADLLAEVEKLRATIARARELAEDTGEFQARANELQRERRKRARLRSSLRRDGEGQ